MGWAERIPSGKYRAVYRDAAGRKRSAGTFFRESDALREAGKAEVDERNMPTVAETKKMTWGEFEEQWHAGRVVEPGTRKTDEPKLNKHLRPKWTNVELREISSDDVQQWVADLSKLGLSPSTVQKCYHLLSGSMRAAVKARIIAVSPCQQIALPRSGPTPERYLSDEEFRAIRAPMFDLDQLLTDTLIGTGVRLGEALGLHWESIDFERKTVTVEWAWDREVRRIKAPKDSQSRTIPIGVKLAKSLKDRLDEDGFGDPAPVEYAGRRKVRTGLVFHHVEGKPMDGDNFRHRFEACVNIAYVGKGKARRKVGHVRLHDLRHTYASRLVRAGVPIQEVSKLLGHATITTTMRYAHLAETQWDGIRKLLG